MPRPRPPPTPTSSTDLKAVEKTSQNSDMEAVFALPPPALRSAAESEYLRRDSKSSTTGAASTGTGIGVPPFQTTPPISPQEKPLSSSPRHKRTASGAIKSQSIAAASQQQPKSNNTQTNGSSYSLPPPPSRARKIIQMKPKSTKTSAASETSDSSYHLPASTTAATAAASNPSTAKSSGAAANSKKGGKQPSATSAAGRKIARKTAHSIIERRRRSKMNEEFGVLKDMIPACEGVEMHKLAILQAGIEYVRYLEGCVAQLKAENENKSRLELAPPRHQQQQQIDMAEDQPSEDDDEDDAGDGPQSVSSFGRRQSSRQQSSHWAGKDEWSLRDSRKSSAASRGSTSTSTSSSYPSPYTQPQGSSKRRILPASASGTTSIAASPLQMPMNSQSGATSSGTPTPTLLSPALNAIHFSPEDQQGRHGSAQMKPSSGIMTTPADAVGSLPSTSSSWATVNHQSLSSEPSPNMQPLPSPKAAVHVPLSQSHSHSAAAARHSVSGTLQLPQTDAADARGRSPGAVSDVSATAEATASAALMMLTNEWRGGGRNASVSVSTVHPGADSRDRSKGMSVRDLLSS
ncbi:hypothetical protein HRR83_007919 [Exophiala dermatitidis]|uniref:BHLH domain-containing protein n=2 Tax=Exophiala dermatitidis TaxID=5970 RepID=H6BUG1_EXODN|nr:uncharacterized protein HMPREF1120_03828 [Exophiala dermatitidis NIH/UT8656]KAJ4506567.1 hypothetical protein HRR75_006808 [Exophiala dermatitidis]EHY55703.1 hypothetical protein HMPREF1120_03828 [Exophiala dermatitidis NIH/UT8656]KAJ4508835.1 hypothetical protein HRR74_007426 [Exophiala dermatitidis]KAJ4510087.1 hypothetical protein HRR73_006884 [Exophiala dermatitidis]KAJ4539090.1 hypothetical protein HRR77_006505 [Exophiala dermatitidis]